jgi:chromosome segregation ATPase
MPYLQNEKARTQAQIQAAEAEVANLAAQEQAQQQAIAQAQTQVNAAQSALAALQAQRPALEGAAAVADRRVADVDAQILSHQANEPEQFVERPPRPPLRNPQWTTWKRRLDQLTRQRQEAQATASAAHERLAALDRTISQAAADLHAVETRVAQAVAALAQLTQAISAAKERAAAFHRKLDELTGWGDEIEREPMERTGLEHVAAGLSSRVIELEDAWQAAEAASAAADATLASLMTRRDQLTAALTDVNTQLPAVEAEVRAAEIAVQELAGQIDSHITGGL